MKKFALLAIALGLLCFGAACQSKKVTTTKAFSVADLASLAILQRNAKKECASVSELLLLQKLIDAQKLLLAAAGEKVHPVALLSGRLCPCPPYGLCPCDSTKLTRVASVTALETNATLVALEGKEKIEMTKKVIENGIVLHEVPGKIKDGHYKLITVVHFQGDPTPVEFEVTAYISKGMLNFSK
jgi:hypothetical protein